MKYLSDYTDQKQTELLNETGAFFAFSNEQFNKQKKEGVKYIQGIYGIICPKENYEKLKNGWNNIFKQGIAQDIKENGINNIIERELHNHEAGYTGDIESAYEVLKAYNVTYDQVFTVFRNLDLSNY